MIMSFNTKLLHKKRKMLNLY